MNFEEFKTMLNTELNYLSINLSDIKLEQFYTYMNLLIEWNKKINLTTIIEPKEIIIKHFVDCGTILKYLKDGENVIDIGTGAGFPGIPVKILNENLNVTLVDSLNKRINFLNEVCIALDLKNIELIHSRAEDLAKNKSYRENFDKSVSRAVANLTTLAEYDLPFIKKGGQMIAMKGFEIDEELQNAEKAINILGGKIKEVNKFTLIDTDNKRSIVLIDKVKPTPKQFPRKAGKPLKEPIK